MTEVESLSAALKKVADQHWHQPNPQPVLLSNLPPLLVEHFPNYKEILGNKSLKQYIKESAIDGGYRLIEHPTQKAKLALLPSDASFEFPGPIVTADQPMVQSDRTTEKALIEFLKALKKLPAADLAEVHIPVSVLVKLVK